MLDAPPDTATLGKTAGKDARQDKPTYVSLLGLSPPALTHELRSEPLLALDASARDASRLPALIDLLSAHH